MPFRKGAPTVTLSLRRWGHGSRASARHAESLVGSLTVMAQRETHLPVGLSSSAFGRWDSTFPTSWQPTVRDVTGPVLPGHHGAANSMTPAERRNTAAGPPSPADQNRGRALLARWVQNYARLQLTDRMARMETMLFAPGPDDDGAGALRVLRGVRGHIRDGSELHAQLLDDLDDILAIADGASPPPD